MSKKNSDYPQVTIFKNIFSKEPFYLSVDDTLERIKSGRSKEKIEQIRLTIDKDKSSVMKNDLPSVCFSGIFKERKDEMIEKHSGFLVLDFDEIGIDEVRDKQTDIINHSFVYACWISPRGNGLKALIKIADGAKHRQHFAALQDIFPDVDKSGVNESRVCFESYDPDIYINQSAEPFKKIKNTEKIEQFGYVEGSSDIFQRLLIWLSNKNNAFVKGERNIFIFKLASACCRFGITEETCLNLCDSSFVANDNTFTKSECHRTVKSAYKSNKSKFGTCSFEKDVLVDKITRSEVEISADIYDPDVKPKDVIYAEEVRHLAINIFENGYESVSGVNSELLDKHFKMKRGELTLVSGIGNYGKSAWMKWYLLLHAVLYDSKFALFPPEDNPPEEFFQDLVEILLGADCTPLNVFKPDREEYDAAYDFVGKHFFYIYPKDLSPTPEYMKERFLELIIKEKIDGCIIDPFNQMTNDYSSSGGRDDKYLETVLGDFDRFAVANNVYFWIISHPKLMKTKDNGQVDCPSVFDLSGGAMWNNKMYNILIYHRPNHHTDPQDPVAELHTKKIKRQKVVGLKGVVDMEYLRPRRRFMIEKCDVLQNALYEKGITFKKEEEAPF